MLVATDRGGVDVYTRQCGATGGHIDDLRRRRVVVDQQRQEGVVGVLAIPDLLLNVPGAQIEHRSQFLGDVLHLFVGNLGCDQGDLVGRGVLDQQIAVAVVDQSASGLDIDGSDAVAGGAGDELVVLQDLKSDQLDGQDAEQQQDEAAENPDLGADGKALAVLKVLRILSRDSFGPVSSRSALH